ncbi:gliding motility lipoprotein GldH [Sphingobacterium lactis]|uniref:gliding motility lipoprotein GldH n=1 Tax=Sphingobacterium lactis TaxID=797291 RepID=UPI003F7D5694
MRMLILFAICILFLGSCQEGAFFERNTVIPNLSWDYDFKPVYEINVQDKNVQYDVFVNMRHTAYYPYSNIYFFLHEKGPGIGEKTTRYEFNLAQPDGRWIGRSAGNLYEQTKLLKEGLSFPDTGKYVFTLEQNMTENPLRGINDVGIKIIKR